ncbi:MAG: hypothetical protein ACI9XO_002506 [Paraglaciecola sp.]
MFPFSPIENRNNSNFLIGAEDIECGLASDGVIYEIDDVGEIVVTYDLAPSVYFLKIEKEDGARKTMRF